MKHSILFLAILVAVTVSRASDTLTFATYNVQNYTLENRQLAAGGGFRPEYPKPEIEKAALRAVIRSMDADVMAFQEIGGTPFLEELRRDLASDGLTYPFGTAMMAEDDKRGLAVLSRVPLTEITEHRDLVGSRVNVGKTDTNAPVRRGMLEVTVPWKGGPVTLFVVHLKSRLTDDKTDPASEEQRAAEALAVRERILLRLPKDSDDEFVSRSARFVVLGDFNDVPGSRPIRALQTKGKRVISQWIDAADTRGHRWTHVYSKQAVYSRFDQVFVSPALIPNVERAWICDTPDTAIASDHRPVILRLTDIHR